MKSKKVNLIFLLAGLLILIFLVWDFGINNIILNVAKVGWWLVPVIAVWLIIYAMNTLAWKAIIGNGAKVGFYKLLSLKITGFSINYLTPVVGLAGEPWKIINVKHLIGVEKASSSVILYNMMHILSHFYFWVTAVILFALTTPLDVLTIIVLGVVLLILLFVIAIFYLWHRKGIVYSFIRFINSVPILTKFSAKIEQHEDVLRNIEVQVVDLYQNRRSAFYFTLFLEYGARVIGSLEFYFIMIAIQSDVSFLQSIYISAASSLLANLVFFIPLQLGTREGSLYLVYESLNFTPALGVFVSLVTRIREFFWIIIGLLLLKLTSRKIS